MITPSFFPWVVGAQFGGGYIDISFPLKDSVIDLYLIWQGWWKQLEICTKRRHSKLPLKSTILGYPVHALGIQSPSENGKGTLILC